MTETSGTNPAQLSGNLKALQSLWASPGNALLPPQKPEGKQFFCSHRGHKQKTHHHPHPRTPAPVCCPTSAHHHFHTLSLALWAVISDDAVTTSKPCSFRTVVGPLLMLQRANLFPARSGAGWEDTSTHAENRDVTHLEIWKEEGEHSQERSMVKTPY